MPTPPISDENCVKAYRAYQEAGSYNGAARLLGMDRMTLKRWCSEYERRGLSFSPGAQSALSETGLNPREAVVGWRRVQSEDGSFNSVMWRAPEKTAVNFLAEIREAFDGITPAAIVPEPAGTLADLCTVYPLMDVHLGMHAWGRETGQDDYSLKDADADMRHALGKIMTLTPASEQAILIIGGDFFHADDNTAQTPASRHNLDVDSRHWKVLDTGIRLVSDVVQTMLEKHSRLLVRVLRGNHDEHSHLVLSFALAEKFSASERVEIEKEPFDLFMFEWGRTAIFAHHGDKGNPQQLVNLISDVCTFWSSTRHRYCFTGHVHHDKVKDLGPVRWHSLRAFAPADNYGAKYGPRRAIQSITFHKQDGRVQENADPIERPA